MVVAIRLDAARAAAERAKLDIEPTEAILDIQTARQAGLCPGAVDHPAGDPDAALNGAAQAHRRVQRRRPGAFLSRRPGRLRPAGRGRRLVVHSSTQHPTEVQHVCAQVLGYDFNRVTTVVRRLGGGFGGKESNASWVAAAAALGAAKTGKPVKLRLPREIDIIATGKRHGFDYRYTVGFDDEGRVLALDAVLAADAGWSLDMTPGVVARALTHVDNAYWIPHVRAVGYLPHQQAVEHGVPRLRRAAGRAGDGGCDRPHRPPSRPRRQRDPRPQLLRRGRRRDALRPEGRREPSGALLGRGEARAASGSAGAPRSMPSTRPTRC